MKFKIAASAAIAGMFLVGCDPDLPPDEVTVTVTETAVETVEVTADPEVITKAPTGPDTTQYGAAGDIQSKYSDYGVDGEVTECWVAKDGIHFQGLVTSKVNQVVDITGTVEAVGPDGVTLGRGGVFIPDAFPGDEVMVESFLYGAEGNEFSCRFVIMETVSPGT